MGFCNFSYNSVLGQVELCFFFIVIEYLILGLPYTRKWLRGASASLPCVIDDKATIDLVATVIIYLLSPESPKRPHLGTTKSNSSFTCSLLKLYTL